MKINKKTNFLIYGAGIEGNRIKNNLTKNDYIVYGFLDAIKQTDILDEKNRTFNTKDISQIDINICDSIVVIGLADGMVHYEVANILKRSGFNYYIFIPLTMPINQNIKIRYIDLFNDIAYGDCQIDGTEIDDIESLLKISNENLNIIQKYENEYVVTFPIELLYLELYDESFTLNEDWFDNPFLGFNNNIYYLFNNFNNGLFDVEHYLTFKKNPLNEDTKNKILMSRYKQHLQFIKEYNQGMDIFISSAPRSIYNKNGYFNIINGHHRTNFLLSQGRRDVPIKISKNEFEFWANEEKFYGLKEILTYEILNKFEYPILNPYFNNHNVNTDLFSLDVVRYVYKIINRFEEKDLSILDNSNGYGYFAHIFSLSRKYKTFYHSEDTENIQITKKIFELYRNDSTKFIDNLNNSKFDICVSLNKVIQTKHELLELYNNNYYLTKIIEIKRELIDEISNIEIITNRVKDNCITSIISI